MCALMIHICLCLLHHKSYNVLVYTIEQQIAEKVAVITVRYTVAVISRNAKLNDPYPQDTYC